MSRGGWAMARVNMYLKMRRGGKVKESYRKADQDVSKSSIEFSEYSDLEIKEAMDDLNLFEISNETEEDLETMFIEELEAELTEKQKKLPPAIQKAILKKKGKTPKDSKDKEKDKGKDVSEKEESDAGHSPSHKKGLWENIRDKKRRMGKNYRPAKPGDKDRPSQEALKKAQESSKKKKM